MVTVVVLPADEVLILVAFLPVVGNFVDLVNVCFVKVRWVVGEEL